MSSRSPGTTWPVRGLIPFRLYPLHTGWPMLRPDLVAQAGDANVTLSWNAPVFDGGRAIDYYVVYQDGVDIGHVPTTFLLVEGLLNGQV